MKQCCSSHNGYFNDDYTQLVAPGTHIISNSGSGNYGNEQRTATYFDGRGLGIRWVSVKFVSQGISTLSAEEETFCDIHGSQFNTSLIWI
jgi:hypothetical protein